jgi:hypothetical protein
MVVILLARYADMHVRKRQYDISLRRYYPQNTIHTRLISNFGHQKSMYDLPYIGVYETANVRQCDRLNCSRWFFCIRTKKVTLYLANVGIEIQRMTKYGMVKIWCTLTLHIHPRNHNIIT